MGIGPRIDCSNDEPLTQQSGKDECDINIIVERAKRGADLSQLLSVRAPMYGDFTSIPTDLREAMATIKFADQLFMSMDAQVRIRFNNDPALMLDFLNDPANREEAIKLGLVKAPEVPKVDETVEALRSIASSLLGPREGVGVQGTPRERNA